MTRDEAKAWFEAALNDPHFKTTAAIYPVTARRREAFAQAVEALAQPKFIALKEGDIAILEVGQRLPAEAVARFTKQWHEFTGNRAIVLDGGARLAGSVKRDDQPYPPPQR